MRKRTNGKKRTIWIRVDLEDYKYLVEKARKTGLYVSTLARKYIKEGIAKDIKEETEVGV